MQISKIPRRTIALIGFIVATVLTSAFAAPVATNYYQFYPSLSHIQLLLTDLQLKNITTYTEVKGFFTVLNPTDYKGFTLTVFRGTFEVDSNNITLDRPQSFPLPPGFVTSPLTKNVPVTVVLPVNATNTGVKNIQIQFVIELVLSTFLDKFGPVIATYICQGTGGPGNCFLAAVSVQGFSPGQGGGRGGGV